MVVRQFARRPAAGQTNIWMQFFSYLFLQLVMKINMFNTKQTKKQFSKGEDA